MKKMLMAIALVFLFCGCSKSEDIKIAVENNYTCPNAVMSAIEEFYADKSIEIVNVERLYLGNKEYHVSIGAIEMGRPIRYGIWKSKVMKYENVCGVGYDDYKMSSDFSGKKVGILGSFNYSDYVYLDNDCEYSIYTNADVALSDIREGVIDAVLCMEDTADSLIEKDNMLRINDILDSKIYEYVVLSEDTELINSLDKVVK